MVLHNLEFLNASLEGLLYISGEEGLLKEDLMKVLEIDEQTLQATIMRLQNKYESDENNGITLMTFGNIVKLVTKISIDPLAKKMFSLQQSNQLSPSALETLAIIAYKQPITRIEIEEIRGVGADAMIRKLLALHLIKESGRSDAPGRPILYEITDNFLDKFQLISLEELPTLPTYDDEKVDNLFE